MTPEDAIAAGFVPRPREGVAAEEIDGEVVLYDDDTGNVHLLNATAATIWIYSDGSRDLDRLIGDLSAAYGLPPAEIADEVRECVCQMGRQGLLAGVEAELDTG